MSRSRFFVFLLGLAVATGLAPTVRAQCFDYAHTFAPVGSIVFQTNRDQKASPLKYSGSYPMAGLRYRYLGHRMRHEVSFSFGATVLESDITKGELSQQKGEDVRISATHSFLLAANATTALYLGATFDNRYNFRYHRYTDRTTEYVGLNHMALSPTLMAVKRLGSSTGVSATVSGALVSFVVRTPYAVKGPVEMGFEGPQDYRSIVTTVTLDQEIGDRLLVSARYALLLDRLEERWPTGSISQGGELSLAFRL